MNILIRDGHIIDPSQELDGIGDILIEDGKIKEVALQKAPHPPITKGGKGEGMIRNPVLLMRKA